MVTANRKNTTLSLHSPFPHFDSLSINQWVKFDHFSDKKTKRYYLTNLFRKLWDDDVRTHYVRANFSLFSRFFTSFLLLFSQNWLKTYTYSKRNCGVSLLTVKLRDSTDITQGLWCPRMKSEIERIYHMFSDTYSDSENIATKKTAKFVSSVLSLLSVVGDVLHLIC